MIESLQTVFSWSRKLSWNDRPITVVSNDVSDPEPLTPNHLLQLKGKPLLPPGVFAKDDCYAKRRWRQVQYLADLFWKRWVKEYLPLMQERQKWNMVKRNLKPGDLVLIMDETSPRNSWPKGRITEVISDSRGHVRRVKLRTGSKRLERPITKLCLLLEAWPLYSLKFRIFAPFLRIIFLFWRTSFLFFMPFEDDNFWVFCLAKETFLKDISFDNWKKRDFDFPANMDYDVCIYT